MSVGVRVLISVKDHDGEVNTEYGYIMRRLNTDLYEIYGESSQVVFWLSKSEFTELPKENADGTHN